MRLNGIVGLAASACVAAMATPAVAQARQFDIPAGNLRSALDTFGRQSRKPIMYKVDEVRNLRTRGYRGLADPAVALNRILAGTGFEVRSASSGALAIVKPGNGVVPEPTSASAEDENPDTDIIVTATRRSESLRNVPLSISAVSGEDIQRRGLKGMEDYLRGIPGVNQIDRGGKDNAIIIRGISTSAEFENLNSGTTVATYFDETPITGAGGLGTGGIDLRPVDFERIEILRGPQGTTFGNSSLGGAVRLIAAKPKTDRFEASLSAALSVTGGYGRENTMVQGMMNIPVVENAIAVRVVAYDFKDSGAYRNIAGVDPAEIAFGAQWGLENYVRGHTQKNVGEIHTRGARVSAIVQPSDDIDLTFTALTQKIEQNGNPFQTSGKFLQSVVPIAPQGRVRGQAGEIGDTKIDLFSAVGNFRLGWADLTVALSHVDSGSVYTNARSRFAPGLGPSSGSALSAFRSNTAEARLATTFDGPFKALVGIFYEDVDQSYLQHSGDWPGLPARNPFGTDPMYLADFDRHLEQKAAFAELAYEILPRLTLTLGARHYDYGKSSRNLEEGGLVGVPFGTGVVRRLSNGQDGQTYRANATYRLTDNSMIYATFSQGFRLGRPDIGVPASVCDRDGNGLIDGSNVTIASTRNIDSDTLDNYELGAKLKLGRGLFLDMSAYHIDWKGLPIRSVITCGTTNASYTANVGAARSRGFDVQAALMLGGGWRADLGFGYTKAELTEDAPGLLPPAFRGDRLPGAPEITASTALQYDFTTGRFDGFARLDAVYVGSFYGDLRQSPGTRAGDYARFNIRAGVKLERFRLEAFVDNITDEDAFTWRGISGAFSGTVNPLFGYRLRPRTIGIEVGYRFD